MKRTSAARILFCLCLFTFYLCVALAQGPIGEGDFKFDVKRRVNAHGDEYNALAISSDRQRLFTGTEKGDIIVWNVAANRLERTLHQPSAIHFVVAPANAREFIAAGSNHFKPQKALVRKWNVETGTFVDLSGIDSESNPTALAVETQAGLVAATTQTGNVVVWDLQTNKQLAQWKIKDIPTAVALLGRSVYVATTDQNPANGKASEGAIIKLNLDNQNERPTDLLRVANRYWGSLASSPDRLLLSAVYQEGFKEERTVVINPVSKSEIANFEAPAPVWLDASQLMLFSWMNPVEVFQISTNQPARSIRKFGQFESDTPGRAFALSGQVTNADGSKAWASYSKGPGLLEFDLSTNKIKTLLNGPSGAYAIDVITQDGQTGELLTGGADGYVRLWNLADISLLKEFKVAKSGHYVSEAYLVPGSRRAVVEVGRIPGPEDGPGPSEITLLDLESGQLKKLFDLYSWRTRIAIVNNQVVYAQGDRIKFMNLDGSQDRRELKVDGFIHRIAVSANLRWLAAVDETQKLTVFDLPNGQKKTISIKADDVGPLVVTDDGLNVYTIEHEGALTHWDISTGKATASVLSKIRQVHSRVDFMTLANDDGWLVTAGNHRDVGIFDRTTGKLVSYVRVEGGAFWVEKVWIKGKRMILTTDTGVMYDGVLQ
jgi:WD40 repeat protein